MIFGHLGVPGNQDSVTGVFSFRNRSIIPFFANSKFAAVSKYVVLANFCLIRLLLPYASPCSHLEKIKPRLIKWWRGCFF